jgi:uncharacterized alpha-E superfamily protein
MLSRVADTIYWLARYMERTQSMLQVIRTNYIASQDEIRYFSWRPLLYAYGELTSTEVNEIERDTPRVLEHLVLDKSNSASAYNNILQGRENARAVQDHITKEVWQCLNDYYHFVRDDEVAQQVKLGDPVSGIDFLMRNSLLFTGTVKNTMPRDESYAYINIGKFLERAIQTADIIRIKWSGVSYDIQQSIETPELRYLLYSLFGYELFVKTYKGNFSPNNVLQMILYNTYFPHSLLYSLNQMSRYFERLKEDSLPESYEQVEFLIGKVKNEVKYSHFTADDPEQLNNFLLQVRDELYGVATAFSKYYFGNS